MNKPHIGQVWKKDEERLVIIALSPDWQKVICSGYSKILFKYPEVSLAWLQANYEIDTDYE